MIGTVSMHIQHSYKSVGSNFLYIGNLGITDRVNIGHNLAGDFILRLLVHCILDQDVEWKLRTDLGIKAYL